MGASKSKGGGGGGGASSGTAVDVRILQKQRRQQVANEFERLEKEDRRRRRAADQMAALQSPAAPFVPKRSAALEPRLRPSDYDAEAKRRMQDQLAWDSQTFVLNQLLLSVQFFDNYERDMWQAVERNRQLECRQSRQIERHCKAVLLPDRLQEAVDRCLKYRPRHGLHKHIERPLHTPTMYIVHENIEVTNAGERSNYSILTDAPVYKMEIDTGAPTAGRPHVGYIRLRCVEGIHINHLEPANGRRPAPDGDAATVRPASTSTDDDGDADDDDAAAGEAPAPKLRTYSKHRDSFMMSSAAMRRRREQRSLSVASTGSGGGFNRRSSGAPTPSQQLQSSSSSSAENDYAYLNALNVRKPLSAARGSATAVSQPSDALSSTTLPDACFAHMAENSASESDDEQDDLSDSDDRRRPKREMHQYLSSKAFLLHFVNVFRDRLAADIGITPAHLNTATWKGAVISAQPWDIVPALSCPWPNEAFEWMHRQRDIKQNPVTLQRFQWPTPDMVSKVVSFGCLAVPLGYAPRSGALNGRAELEWRLVFPNAERYLEGCLTAAQCKVYVLARALLQTFVEPFVEVAGGGGGLSTEHLRAHLFWQCEHNYAAWPEEYLGEALVRFLNALLEHIKRQRLPDYFLPRRNLFENVPERVMVDLHKRIFRITENPVMYAMIALRNLRWMGDAGGVHLDLKTLYGIMTVDNPLQMVNPNFRKAPDALGMVDGGPELEEDGCERTVVGGIGNFQKMARSRGKERRRKTHKVRFMEAERELEEAQAAARRVSQESIDVRFPIVKHMEQLRRVLLYELFIAHYLQMARAAATATHKAHNLALIYLKQASRICQLLADDDRGEQAASYASCVETLQQVVLNEQRREADAKPQLPQRESFARRAGGGDAGPGTVSRVRVAPQPNGAYTNLMAMNGAIDALAAKVSGAVKPRAPKPPMASILRVQCDVHTSRNGDHDEVRRPQTPIVANSFFEAVGTSNPVLVLSDSGHFELRNGAERTQQSADDEDVTAL